MVGVASRSIRLTDVFDVLLYILVSVKPLLVNEKRRCRDG